MLSSAFKSFLGLSNANSPVTRLRLSPQAWRQQIGPDSPTVSLGKVSAKGNDL